MLRVSGPGDDRDSRAQNGGYWAWGSRVANG